MDEVSNPTPFCFGLVRMLAIRVAAITVPWRRARARCSAVQPASRAASRLGAPARLARTGPGSAELVGVIYQLHRVEFVCHWSLPRPWYGRRSRQLYVRPRQTGV